MFAITNADIVVPNEGQSLISYGFILNNNNRIAGIGETTNLNDGITRSGKVIEAGNMMLVYPQSLMRELSVCKNGTRFFH